MVVLFALTLFLSASLMFIVEPMIGKMLLPLLGGTPAVWNSCMMFFQGVLLIGYGYAHLTTRWLGVRRQAVVHAVVLMLPLLLLPVHIGEHAAASVPVVDNPIPWLLSFLTVTACLPLFVVSTTAPLLQRWFSSTTHPRARDPYFLYAASNAGSMVGLLSYPVLVEPTVGLVAQSRLWTAGYAALVLLTLGCAVVLWRSAGTTESAAPAAVPPSLTISRRVRWVVLAFVPSSLMLGVTTYLSTDVAPFPLLWVVPLALYILTFILVFARRAVVPRRWMGRTLCVMSILLVFMFMVQATQPVWLCVAMHLMFLFLAALVCHGTLAQDRPAPAHLTEYFLWLSFGGVLGGVFNSLLAPVLFSTVLEYPLVVLLLCAVRPGEEAETRRRVIDWRDFAWGLGTAAVMGGVIVAMQLLHIRQHALNALWIMGAPALMTYRFVKRPVRSALCLAGMLAVALWYAGRMTRAIHVERNFFGVLRISVDSSRRFFELVHGTTLHGRAWLDPARKTEPTAYYHRTGPAGQFFAAFDKMNAAAQVALIGLGAGELTSYARPTDRLTYYEINPAVVRIACNPRRFSFIKNSAAPVGIVLGDARIQLRYAASGEYRVIVIDAFSSDSIPVHLITREAVRLYLEKLADDGILLFHISNRRLDLKPVIANLAQDAGLVAFMCDDTTVRLSELADGKEPSTWVALARREADLGTLAADARWERLSSRSGIRLWSDDFSNVLQVIRWH